MKQREQESLYSRQQIQEFLYIRLWVHESLQTADVGISIHVRQKADAGVAI